MTEEKQGKNKRRRFFYDVERFKQVNSETQEAKGPLGRILARITGALSSMQGIFLMMSAPLIIFGMIFLVIYTLFLGPLVFMGMVVVGLVGLTVVVERRLGSADNFIGSDFWKRTAGQLVGYSLAILFILLFLFAGRIPLPHFIP